MSQSFFERPILNSPYEPPKLHHALDAEGQPLDVPPVEGRRKSELITPVPKPRKRKGGAKQGELGLGSELGPSTPEQEYNPTPIINGIRQHVASWRALPNPADWGVTPATAHWTQKSGKRSSHDWYHWWAETAPKLTEEQLRRVWLALDKVHFYEVVALSLE